MTAPGPVVHYTHECNCGTTALVTRTADPYEDAWTCPRCEGSGTISHNRERGSRHDAVKAQLRAEAGR